MKHEHWDYVLFAGVVVAVIFVTITLIGHDHSRRIEVLERALTPVAEEQR